MAYERGGIIYPRCTAVISDCTNKSGGLVQWGANQVTEWIRENVEQQEPGIYPVTSEHLEQARFAYKATSQKALDIGSEVHAAIEATLKGGKAILSSEQADRAFNAFREWEKDVDLKPIRLEQTVWGKRWAGTLDYLGYYKDKLYVIDWKTSKAFYMTEMGAQIAAYRSCIPDVEGCGILRLDKETGMPEFKDFSKRYQGDLQVFEKMVELYFLKHSRISARFNKKA